MELKSKIMAENKGQTMTYKQGGLLFTLTGLKFWQPESQPQPTIGQATLLIGALLEYVKNHNGTPAEIIEAIQIWFPGFTDISKIHMRKFRPKPDNSGTGSEPEESKQQPESSSRQQAASSSAATHGGSDTQKPAASKSKPEPKPESRAAMPGGSEKPSATESDKASIRDLIEAGLRNVWMVGPAGCGKTTICKEVGADLGLPVTVIPCGAGTSATTFLGYKYPERESTPFVAAFSQPGIIVLDEFTALEAQVAQIVNGALANDELSATTGTLQRDPDCIVIATSNTFGHGADRMYVSNNQLDASTIDRFACGIVEMDYSAEYESQYDAEVVAYVRNIRGVITRNGLRKVASTRTIINSCKLKAFGKDWKSPITANWSNDEKKLL